MEIHSDPTKVETLKFYKARPRLPYPTSAQQKFSGCQGKHKKPHCASDNSGVLLSRPHSTGPKRLGRSQRCCPCGRSRSGRPGRTHPIRGETRRYSLPLFPKHIPDSYSCLYSPLNSLGDCTTNFFKTKDFPLISLLQKTPDSVSLVVDCYPKSTTGPTSQSETANVPEENPQYLTAEGSPAAEFVVKLHLSDTRDRSFSSEYTSLQCCQSCQHHKGLGMEFEDLAFLKEAKKECGGLLSPTALPPPERAVPKLMGWGCAHTFPAIVLESLRGSTLSSVLSRIRCGGLTDPVETRNEICWVRHLELWYRISWCAQLARGLAFIHSRGILHRDIKGENIVFRSNPSHNTAGELAFIDYGSSEAMRIHSRSFGCAACPKFLDRRWTASSESFNDPDHGGSVACMSPEALAGCLCITCCHSKGVSDVWSMGLVIRDILDARDDGLCQGPLCKASHIIGSYYCPDIMDGTSGSISRQRILRDLVFRKMVPMTYGGAIDSWVMDFDAYLNARLMAFACVGLLSPVCPLATCDADSDEVTSSATSAGLRCVLPCPSTSLSLAPLVAVAQKGKMMNHGHCDEFSGIGIGMARQPSDFSQAATRADTMDSTDCRFDGNDSPGSQSFEFALSASRTEKASVSSAPRPSAVGKKFSFSNSEFYADACKRDKTYVSENPPTQPIHPVPRLMQFRREWFALGNNLKLRLVFLLSKCLSFHPANRPPASELAMELTAMYYRLTIFILRAEKDSSVKAP